MAPNIRFGKVGLVICAVALIAALGGLAAPYLAGRWIEFDVLSHLRLHFIGLAATAVMALIARRVWLPVLCAGLLATPVVIGLSPMFAARTDEVLPVHAGEMPLKILTYNTWFRNQDWQALESYIRKEDADVVILLEFGASKRPLLDRLKSEYPHRADCIAIKHCRLVLLSKKPFRSAGHKTKWSGPPIIWARYGQDLGGLTVIGAHLPRPPAVTPQFLQVRELAKETLKVGDPVIVAGDFNATEWSFTLAAFQEFSGLWRLTSEPTWPTHFFGLAQFGIDHIFISNGLRPLAYPKRGEDVGSDHLPMSARIVIMPKAASE
ncbi:MAG: endonuclease/exonuclease/phosphatase family protein [Hyphomicrobiales bacterium]